jgi:hypothetical protein
MRIIVLLQKPDDAHRTYVSSLFPHFATDYWWNAISRFPIWEDDPRTLRLYKYLHERGLLELDERGTPKQLGQVIYQRRREYDLVDLAAAEYLYLVDPLLEQGHQSVVDPGTLPPRAIWAHADRTFSVYNQMFLARTYGIEVLEREAPQGLTLHPVLQLPLGRFCETAIIENEFGNAEFKAMGRPESRAVEPVESRAFKRIDSSITLPPLPEELVMPSPYHPKATRRGPVETRQSAFSRIEPVYRRSELEAIGPFDIARFYERFVGEREPGLIISKRLYQLLRHYHFLADVVPVRIIEE